MLTSAEVILHSVTCQVLTYSGGNTRRDVSFRNLNLIPTREGPNTINKLDKSTDEKLKFSL